MSNLSQYHSYIDELLLQCSRGDLFFDEQILVNPIKLSDTEIGARRSAYQIISTFFSRAREIFRHCLFVKTESKLKNLLVNDSGSVLPSSFYHELPEAVWTNPIFFRTDESKTGKIFEIQCPGSGWGDLLLLSSLYQEYCQDINLTSYDPKSEIVRAIQTVCGSENPAVMHLLDNSSNPSSMLYLIRNTQPPLRYWGDQERSVR